MAPPEPSEFDAQDIAEVLDETHLTEDGEDIANFDEIADVYDVTTALGDTREDAAMDEADFDAAAVDYVDSDEEEEVDDHLRDELEDVPEDNDLDPDIRDEDDGVTRLSADEVDLKDVGDIDALTDPADEDAEIYESNRLSDEESQALGYPSEKEKQDAGKTPQGSGATPDDVADESHPRQEELLDEGLEESFPASDPVSVKRIT
jgi:hypothetical protein